MDAFSQNLRKIWTREAFIKVWNVIVRVVGVSDVWLARSDSVRVTTCQENPEKSRKLTTVRYSQEIEQKSGKCQGGSREKSCR